MNMYHETDSSVVDLICYLRKKLLLITAMLMACAMVGFLGTKLFVKPEYVASTRVYVLNRSHESVVVYSDYQISSKMLNDYKVLITGRNVTGEVIKQLGLTCSNGELAEMISVTSPEGSQFVQIDVTDQDPYRAAKIANALRDVASVQIRELMAVDAVNLVYEAEVPTEPTAPKVVRNTILAAGGGLTVTLAVLVFVFAMNNSKHRVPEEA